MKNNPYSKGYIDGYKAGKRLSEELVKTDIQSLYSAMLLVLYRKYDFTEDELLDVLDESQMMWDELAQQDDSVHMWDILREETGINITQKA